MSCTKYTSKRGNTLWLPKRWGADDTRAAYLNKRRRATATGSLVDQPSNELFRVMKRSDEGLSSVQYIVLTPAGQPENAFRTVGDAMNWCLERLDQERGG